MTQRSLPRRVVSPQVAEGASSIVRRWSPCTLRLPMALLNRGSVVHMARRWEKLRLGMVGFPAGSLNEKFSHFFTSKTERKKPTSRKKRIKIRADSTGWVFLDLQSTFGIFEWLFGETFRRIHLVSEWTSSWWFVKARIQNPQKVGKPFSYEENKQRWTWFLIKSGTWSLLVTLDVSFHEKLPGWWFQRFFIFIPIWERFPFWLKFFKGVETTNQLMFQTLFGVKHLLLQCCIAWWTSKNAHRRRFWSDRFFSGRLCTGVVWFEVGNDRSC